MKSTFSIFILVLVANTAGATSDSNQKITCDIVRESLTHTGPIETCRDSGLTIDENRISVRSGKCNAAILLMFGPTIALYDVSSFSKEAFSPRNEATLATDILPPKFTLSVNEPVTFSLKGIYQNNLKAKCQVGN